MPRVLEAEPLSNKVTKEIVARIARGMYGISSRLPPEREMCEALGVSRITLREALAKLQALGVIQTRHGSGNYVNGLDDVDLPSELMPEIVGFDSHVLEEIIQAREALESCAAKLAAVRRSRRDIDELRSSVDDMSANTDHIEKFLPADMRFHRLLVKASKNRILERLMVCIQEQQKYSQMFTTYLKDDQPKAIEFHRKILDAIKARDGKAAVRTVRNHLRDMRKYLVNNPSGTQK